MIGNVGLKHRLVTAGPLDVGDAVAYFPSGTVLDVDDRVVQQDEFIVVEVGEAQFKDETVYVMAGLKRAGQSVQADFHGSNMVFFDDFDSNRESWTVKSGSWNLQNGVYNGSADEFEVALTVAGQSDWKNIVFECKVTLETGNAALVFRYSGSSMLQAVLRPDEGVVTLEKISGNVWMRLHEHEYNLQYDTEYTLRVHALKSSIFIFLDGAWLFTCFDSSLRAGMIGLKVLGGEAYFDDATVWEATL